MLYTFCELPKGTKLCQILTGDKVRRKCSEVTTFNVEELTAAIWRMVRACIMDDGAGLAAPQIGIYKRIFVKALGDGAYRAYINPNFTPIEGSPKEAGIEGCLSVPGKRISVKRYTAIKATWEELTAEGTLEPHTELLEGWDARVFQHEKDHLSGIDILMRHEEQRRSKTP